MVHYKRCKRWDFPYNAHCLTFSCVGRRPFLTSDRARGWFVDAIETARHEHRFDLWAWVFMPEHAHLLIYPRDGAKISPILQAIKQPVAQRCIHWLRKNDPVFLRTMMDDDGRCRFWLPGGGYDRNVSTARKAHEKLKYIHANPVKRGLVREATDWPWSSAKAWATGDDTPLRIDRDSVPLPS